MCTKGPQVGGGLQTITILLGTRGPGPLMGTLNEDNGTHHAERYKRSLDRAHYRDCNF